MWAERSELIEFVFSSENLLVLKFLLSIAYRLKEVDFHTEYSVLYTRANR